jgi:hypothetical protein
MKIRLCSKRQSACIRSHCEPLEARIAPAAVSWTGTINLASAASVSLYSGSHTVLTLNVVGDDTLSITGGSLTATNGGSVSNLNLGGSATFNGGALTTLTGAGNWTGDGTFAGTVRNEGTLTINPQISHP